MTPATCSWCRSRPVEATEITLTITGTTSPGAGGRFDRTALSEVQFANR